MDNNSTLSLINKWTIRIFSTFWVVFILLDYIKNHVYYSTSIQYSSYTLVICILLIIFIGLIYLSSSNKKLNSLILPKITGVKIYGMLLLILTVIFLNFGNIS